MYVFFMYLDPQAYVYRVHVSEGLVYQVLYRHVREVAGSWVQGLGFRRWDFGFKIAGHALVLIPQELLMSEYICCLLKP